MPSTPPSLGLGAPVPVGDPDPELLMLTLFVQLVGTILVVAFWLDWRWSWERAQELRRLYRR